MAIDETQQYVDWAGLRYYDQRVKAYIDAKVTNSEDQTQFREDLEQLENRIQTLADNFTTDKTHIYEHIDACKKSSATKEELASSVAALREEIKTLTGVDLGEYATKEQLSAVEAKIPSVEGLASETYVDEKVVAIEDHESRIGILEYNYQAQSQLHSQRFDSLQEQDTAIYKKIDQVEDHVSEKMDTVYAEKTFAGKTDLYNTNLRITNLEDSIPEIPTNISTFTNDAGYLTDVPEEYVTDEELEARGYLTEHQSLEGLATEQFVADEIAKLDCVTNDEVESLIDEKIEAAITDGATVSSISYGTF